jgi:hypothetical protein
MVDMILFPDSYLEDASLRSMTREKDFKRVNLATKARVTPTVPYSDNQSGDLNINAFVPPNSNSVTIEPLNGGQVIIKSMIEDRILSYPLVQMPRFSSII